MTTAAATSSLSKFMFDGMAVRGVIVRISGEWQRLLQQRPPETAFPAAVRRVLGEMTAASALLQANIKFDGALIMQLYGDGPLKLAVAEMQSDLRCRATAKVSGPVAEEAGLAALANRHGVGRCAITLEPRDGARAAQSYQGVVPLNDENGRSLDSIAGMIELYMQQSEQLHSKLVLAADDECAAGLLLQRLPLAGGRSHAPQALAHMAELDAQAQDENFHRLSLLAASLKPEELLRLPTDEVLHRLFWEEPLRRLEMLSGPDGPRFSCTCSRERVGHMLQTLGVAEVEDIVREQGRVEISCEFCGKQYHFDPVDAAQLFVQGRDHPPASQELQ